MGRDLRLARGTGRIDKVNVSDNAFVGQIVGKMVKIGLFLGFFGCFKPFFEFLECL